MHKEFTEPIKTEEYFRALHIVDGVETSLNTGIDTDLVWIKGEWK